VTSEADAAVREREEAQASALATAAQAGIHVIAVPTPFLVGRINCYVIEDDPLTLVDTGPNSGKSLDDLVRGLRALGHAPEDIGLIVITHQHMDHLGLVEVLQRRSGADVASLDLLGPYLEHFSASATADDEYAQRVMTRHGVPPEVVTVLGSVGAAFRSFGSGAHVTRPLRDGEELRLRDRGFRISHRPGHSPSDILLYDEDRRILLAGDHLLSKISSNPTLNRSLHVPPEQSGDGGPDRPHALIDYIASMRATREMTQAFTLGGHGPPVIDHVALIDERLRMHERRARRVRAMLDAGPATAYEMASEMWGNIAVTQAYLTLSEIIGHLDLLVADGSVTEDASGPVTRFVAA
jgi:glyoxylase-like metal-dependent hydrolase (beta-lactamase superfamily II)